MSDRLRSALRQPGEEPGSLHDPSGTELIQGVARGCLGGFVATVVMTVYRIPVFKALPPTADFWAAYVGGGTPEDYPLPGLLLHLFYGTVAGGVYGLAMRFMATQDPTPRERNYLISGLGYGLVLSVFGSRMILVRVLGRELQPEDALVFHVGHAIYGVTLGTFLSSREDMGEVYDKSDEKQTAVEKLLSG